MKTIARIEQKNVDATSRTMSGIASHSSPDRLGDIIEAGGIRSAPGGIPLLLHHDHRLPVGRARLLAPTTRGTPFEATLPAVTQAGALRDRIEEAFDLVLHRLIDSVSIGFRPLDYEAMQNGAIRYKQIEVLELSLVTVPAHPSAIVSANKVERNLLLRRLGSTTRHASPFDRSAHAAMVEAMYRDDPRLAALRSQRIQRQAAEAHQRACWRCAFPD